MTEYTSNIKRFCSVYKSSKKKEMYLYVDRKYDLKTLPEALRLVFGEPLRVLDMILTPEKKLARISSQCCRLSASRIATPPLDKAKRSTHCIVFTRSNTR